ncbi:DDE superfamily endonuclease [Phytophthora infestans]|uniref:DDE superfamily endonuclease n=1 Tax=Phytophthora infestans TaxID=4787 RepID=A0A8S9U8R8_PHYIN|nr:DDE superfamily endonuclease [Phytophthora infestans]
MLEESLVLAATALNLVLVEDAAVLFARSPIPRPVLTLKGNFNFNALSDGDCRFNFRFWKRDVIRLHKALRLEEDYKLPSRLRVGEVEGLCVLLRRLAYPGRYGDLAVMFGRSPSALCLIFRFMVDLIYTKCSKLLALECGILSLSRCGAYAAAVVARGSPIDRCIGFIDGTVRGIARPVRNQRQCYNGHKRKHALKYQGVMAPDGLFIDFYGPVLGRRHDVYLLRVSEFLQRLVSVHGESYCLYGDPAYPNRPTLQVGFKGSRLSRDQEAFNGAMSAVRVSVEWGFGGITRLWPYVDVKVSSKLLLSPVGKYYLVAALLTNFRNCTSPNQISRFFGVSPPSLETYVALAFPTAEFELP